MWEYFLSYSITVHIWTRQICCKLFGTTIWTPVLTFRRNCLVKLVAFRWGIWHQFTSKTLRDVMNVANERRESQNILDPGVDSLGGISWPSQNTIWRCLRLLRNTYLKFNSSWYDAFLETILAERCLKEVATAEEYSYENWGFLKQTLYWGQLI